MTSVTVAADSDRPVECGGSQPPRHDRIPQGGLAFKACSKCGKEKLISDGFTINYFGKDGLPRYNSVCKDCVRQRVRDYKLKHPKVYYAPKLEWRQKNAAHLAAYQKAYQEKLRARRKASRPAPTPCPKNHANGQYWQKGSWHCRGCQKIEANKRERLRDRQKNATRQAKIFESEYGPKFAAAYLSIISKNPKKSTNIRLVEVIRHLLPITYRRFRIENIERIYKMNRLLNLPIWNVGWTCQRCAIYSADFRFFDLDHITPVHKKGHGKRDNLQVLCPNCHRRKTICDLYGSALDPDFLSVHDHRITSTQHRSNPVLNQGINPLIPASLPVADRPATALDPNQRHHTPVDTSNSPVDQCPAVEPQQPLMT